MDKKATSIILMIFEVLVVITVIFMTLQVAMGYAKSDTVIKVNAANDLMLMINVLVGVPGDAVVEFPGDLSNYIISLDVGSVAVFKEGEPTIKYAIRTFYLPEKHTAEGTVENVRIVCLKKDGYVIILKECGESESISRGVPVELGAPDVNGIYTYDAGIHATPLYYKYNKDRKEWRWSPDEDNWMPTTTIIVNAGEYSGEKPVEENIKIIQYLQKNNPNPFPKAENEDED